MTKTSSDKNSINIFNAVALGVLIGSFFLLGYVLPFSPAFAANIEAVLTDSTGSTSFDVQSNTPATVASIDSEGNALFKKCLRVSSTSPKCTTANQLIVDGNIGIGQPVPAYALDVTGSGRLTGSLRVGTGAGTLLGTDNSIYPQAASGYLNLLGGLGNAIISIGDTTIHIATGNRAEKVTINADGNIGINSTTPGSRLDVVGGLERVLNGTSAPSAYRLAMPAGSLYVQEDLQVDGNVYLGDASTDNLTVIGSLNFVGGANSQYTGPIKITVDDNYALRVMRANGTTDVFYVDTNALKTVTIGNAGIGTSAPVANLQVGTGSPAKSALVTLGTNDALVRGKLEVDDTLYGVDAQMSGNTTIAGNLTVNGLLSAPIALTGDLNMGNIPYVMNGGTNGLVFNPNNLGTVNIVMGADGNLGIGSAQPGAGLVVGTGSGAGVASARTDIYIQRNLEVDNLLYATNAGIGSTSPAQRLDVSGGTFISGNVGIGSSAPGAKLDVDGGVYVWTRTGTVNYARNAGDLYVQDTLEVDGNVYLGDAITDNLTVSGSLNLAGNTNYTGPVSISTTNGNAFTVSNTGGVTTYFKVDTSTGTGISNFTGNVGINTTSPRGNLEITRSPGTVPTFLISSATTANGDYVVVTSAGNVGVGSTAPTALLDINGTIYGHGNVGIGTSEAANLLVVGSASQFQVNTAGAIAATTGITTSGGYTQSGTGANTLTGTSTFSNATYSALFTGGNVGIGTTSPGAKLVVDGGVYIWTGTGTVNRANQPGDLYVERDLEVDGNVYLGDASADNLTVMGALNLSGSTNYNGPLTITTDDANALRVRKNNLTQILNVDTSGTGATTLTTTLGIGTTSGGAALSVGAGSDPFATGAGDAYIERHLAVSTDAKVGNVKMSANTIEATNDSGLRLFDNASGGITVADGGNVGIGSTAPGARLDVDGGVYIWNGSGTVNYARNPSDLYVQGTLEVDGNVYLGDAVTDNLTVSGSLNLAGNTSYAGPVSISTTNVNAFSVSNTGGVTTYFNVDTSTGTGISNFVGNVGINTTTPRGNLEITRSPGTVPPLMISSATTANGDYLIVTSAGNVGINTTQPAAKLEVGAGNLLMDNNQSLQAKDLAGTARSLLTMTAGDKVQLVGASNENVYIAGGTGRVTLGANSDSASQLGVSGNVSVGAGYLTAAAPSNGLIVEGNVGIGSAAPQTRLDVDGTIYGINVGINSAQPGGQLDIKTSGALKPLVVTNTASGDYLVMTSAGNVAIGSTTPGSKLDVVGGVTRILNGSSAPTVNLARGPGSLYVQEDLEVDGNVYIGDLDTDNLTVAGNLTLLNSMVLTGNVGINTTVPTANLEVVRTPATQSPLKISSATGAAASGDFLIVTSAGNIGIGSVTPQHILDVEGTVYFGSGNVGIGTADPLEQLSIYGSGAKALLIQSANNTATLRLRSGTDNWYVREDSADADKLKFITDGTGGTVVTFDRAGNVGVGSAAPQQKLDVEGAVYFGSGNVGIGTAAPGARLDVDGGVYIWNSGTGTVNYARNSGDLYVQGTLEVDGNVYLGDAVTDNLTVAGSLNLAGNTSYTGPVSIATTNAGAFSISNTGGVTTYFNVDTSTGTGISNFVGNVGINTTTPRGNLEITRSPGTVPPLMISSATTANGDYLIVTSAGNVGINTATPAERLDVNGAIYGHGNVGIGTATARALLDVDGGVYIVGNVGLGTTAPRAKMEVNGTLLAADGTSAAPAYAFGAATNTGIRRTVGGDIAFTVAGSDSVYYSGTMFQLANAGTASAPTLTLSGDIDTGLFFPAANTLAFAAGGSEGFRLASTGNVGIGSAAPQQKLDVEGAVYFGSGNVGIGTAAPGAKLDVDGGVYIWNSGTGTVNYARNSGDLYVQGTLEVDGNVYLGDAVTDNLTVAGSLNLAGNTSYTGPVSIATTNAGAFSISNTGGVTTYFNVDTSTGTGISNFVGNVGINTTTPRGNLEITRSPGTVPPLMISSATTANGDYLIVTSAGNVGLGSTTPREKLDVEGSVYIGSGGNVGIGTVSSLAGLQVGPGSSTLNATLGSAAALVKGNLEVDGKIYGDGSGLTGVPGSISGLVTNYVPKAASAFTLANSQIFDDGTNIGIGSLTPQQKLDVEGTVYFGSGNVGIGIANASSILHLYSNTVGENTALTIESDAENASMTLDSKASGNTSIAFLQAGAGRTLLGYNDTGDYFRIYNYGTSTDALAVLYSSGNVGIGTAAPGAKLDVDGGVYIWNSGTGTVNYARNSGDLYVQGTLEVDGNVYLGDAVTDNLTVAGSLNLAGNTSYTGPVSIATTNTGALSVSNAGGLTTYFNVDTSTGTGISNFVGNVGINTTTPRGNLEITRSPGTVPPLMISSAATANGDYLIVTSAGNVGIGTAATRALLDVEGAVYLRGNVGIGTLDPEARLAVKVPDTVPTASILTIEGASSYAGTVYGLRFNRLDGSMMFGVSEYNHTNVGERYPAYVMQEEPGIVGFANMGTYLWADSSGSNQLMLTGFYKETASGFNFLELTPIGYDGALTVWGQPGTFGGVAVNNGRNKPANAFQVGGSVSIGDSTSGYMSAVAPVNGLIVEGNVGIGTLTAGQKLEVDGNVYVTGGNVGIGTWIPTLAGLQVGSGASGLSATLGSTAGLIKGNLEVDGKIYGDGSQLTNVSGTVSGLTPNAVPRASSATTLVDSGIFVVSGNVGMGSAAPQQKLDVEGAVYFGSGNVGIGTASPRQLLDVDGAVYLKGNVGIGTSMPTLAGLQVGGGTSSLNATLGSTAALIKGNLEVDGKLYGDGSQLTGISPSQWSGTAGSPIYYNSANVGIGSSAPQQKLDVEGTVYFGSGNVGVGTAEPVGLLDVNRKLTVLSGGNVGIGSATPTAMLDVNGTIYGHGNVGIGTSAGRALLDVDGSVYMQGNVGIGTLTPTAQLQVQGDVYLGSAITTDTKVIRTKWTGTTSSYIYKAPSLSLLSESGTGGLMPHGGDMTFTAGNGDLGGGWPASSGGNLTFTAGRGLGTNGAIQFRTYTSTGGLTKADIYTDTSNNYITFGSQDAYSGVQIKSGGQNDYPGGPVNITAADGGSNGDLAGGDVYISSGAGSAPAASGKIYLRISTSTAAIITDAGNVGIATTSPNQKLEVDGNVYVTGGNVGIGTWIPSLAGLQVGSGASSLSATLGSAAALIKGNLEVDGKLYGDGSQLTGISSSQWSGTGGSPIYYNSANVGIGSSAPQQKLDVEGAVYFGTGNVGIGSAVPSAKLDVNGTIYGHGNIGIGTATARALLDVEGAVYLRGNVGIDATAPGAKLEVVQGGAFHTAPFLDTARFYGPTSGGYSTNAIVAAYEVNSGKRIAMIDGAYQGATAWVYGDIGVGGWDLGSGPEGRRVGEVDFFDMSSSQTDKRTFTIYSELVTAQDDWRADLAFLGAQPNIRMLGTYGNVGDTLINPSGGNVGIGTTWPNQLLEVDGNVYVTGGNVGIGTGVPALAGLQVGSGSSSLNATLGPTAALIKGNLEVDGKLYGDGSGLTGIGAISGLTTNYLPKATSSTAIGNSQIIDDGTNVGIGSVTPQQKLDVEGTVYFGSGNVGIGTASPMTKLQVTDTSSASPRGILSSQISSDTNGARVGFSKARGVSGALTTVVTGDTIGRLMFRGYDGSNYLEMASIEAVSTGTVASTRVPTYMSFSTGTDATPSLLTERLRINSAGNVGISSTAPTALLDINGTIYGHTNVGIGTAATRALLDVEGAVYMRGNVGIGSVQPAAALDVRGDIYVGDAAYSPRLGLSFSSGTGVSTLTTIASNGWSLEVNHSAAPPIVFKLGSGGSTVERMRITNVGNVGISSSSPQQTLDVEGTVYFGTGNVGIGTALPRQMLDVDGAVYMKGNVGIGTTTPTLAGLQVGGGASTLNATLGSSAALIKGNLEVDGKLYGDGSGLTGVSSISGLTTNYLPKATSSTAIGNSQIIDDGTNVGIGSVTPQQKLDVEGTVYFGSGNVGIGTAFPMTRLQVTDTSSGSPRGILSSQISSDTNGARVGFSKARGVSGALTTVVTGDTIGRLMFRGYDGSNYLEMASIEAVSTGTVAATRVPTYMSFSTGTDATPSVLTERLRINSAGNVGISSTAPTALLDVGGTIYGHSNVGIGTTASRALLDVEGSVYIGSGNVGIGSSVPQSALEIYRSSGEFRGMRITTPNNDTTQSFEVQTTLSTSTLNGRAFTLDVYGETYSRSVFYSTGAYGIGPGSATRDVFLRRYGTNQLMIDSNMSGGSAQLLVTGNTGIGTTAPNQRLEVDGSVYVTGGNVGIGTWTPTLAGLQVGGGASSLSATLGSTAALVKGNLEVDGKIYGDGSALTGVAATGSLTQNYVTKMGSSSLSNSQIFDNGTNVGIGSVTPQQKLDVEGTVYFGSGNVGIGTASPMTRLQVTDTSSGSPRGILSSQISSDTNGARVGFSKARGVSGALTTVVTGDTIGRLMFRGYDGSNYLEMASIEAVSTGTVAATRVPTYMSFSTGTDATPSVLTERLRINSAGNVGIGSTAPTALLDVSGTIYGHSNVGIGTTASRALLDVEGAVYASGTVGIGTTNPSLGKLMITATEASPSTLYAFANDTSSGIASMNAGYFIASLSGNGTFSNAVALRASVTKTGAGLISNGYGLYVDALTGNNIYGVYVTSQTNGYAIYTAGTTSSYFGGNVGIGSAAPQQKLDVEGSIYVGSGGNIGIGTASPAAGLQVGSGTSSLSATLNATAALIKGNLEVDGKIYGDGSQLTNVPGSVSGLTTNYVAKASSSNTVTNSQIFDNGTNVGIGSTTPTAFVDINGTLYGHANVGIGTAAARALLDVEGAVYMRGNVGIGTVSPTESLELTSTGYTKVKMTGNTAASIIGSTSASTSKAFGFGAGTGGTAFTYSTENNGYFAITRDLKANVSNLGGTNVLYADNDGTITLGNSKLSIETEFTGNGEMPSGIFVGSLGSNNYFQMPSSDDGTSGIKVGLAYYNQSQWYSALEVANVSSGYSSLLLMKSGGNVGIGTTSPNQKLEVDGNLYVTGGNVGIGTWNPSLAGLQVGPGSSSLNATLGATSALIKGNLEVDGKLYGDGAGLTNVPGSLSGLAANYLAKASSSNTVINSQIFDNGTNVGIGSASPQQNLDIEGTVYFGSGNIGIGTASPMTKLQVTDTSSGSPRGILSSQITSDTNGARVGFSKARGVSGALTTVVTGDTIGRLMFRGYDGSNYLEMASIEAVSTGTVAATRVPTYMSFSTGTDATPSVLTERVRINSAGNVGIGSTAPTALLDINGTIYGHSNVGIGSSNPLQKLDVEGSIYVGLGQNIGIGTSSPIAPLEISVPAGSSTYAVNILGSVNDFFQINLQNKSSGAGAQSGIAFTRDDGTNTDKFAWFGINNSGFNNPQAYNVGNAKDMEILVLDGWIYEAAGSSGKGIQFLTGGVSSSNIRMTIDPTGNLGIGDSTPDSLLDLLSSSAANTYIKITNTNAGDYDAAIQFELTEGTPSFTMGVDDSDSDKFKISTTALGTNDRLVINSSGNVGIGIASPVGLLDVNSRLTVLSAGNVGIGSTVPNQKLEVDGNVYVTAGNVGIGTWTPGLAGLQVGSGASNLSATLGSTAALIKGNLEVDGKIYGDGSGMTGLTGITGWTVSGTNVYKTSSGNVGLGSTTPQASLEILRNGSTAPLMVSSSLNGDYLVVTSDGNVGIGSTTPVVKMYVNGSAIIKGSSTAGTEGEIVYDSGAHYYKYYNGTTWEQFVGGSVTYTGTLWEQQGNVIYYGSGNVGIGTSTAITQLLTLHQLEDSSGLRIYGFDDQSGSYGDIHITSAGDLRYRSNAEMIFETNGSTNFIANSTSFTHYINARLDDNISLLTGADSDYALGYNSADDTFRIADGGNLTGSPRLVMNSNGNIGIGGDTTPDATLEVASVSGRAPFMVSNGDTGDGDLIIVNSAGNIGIGSSLAQQKLDVEGAVYIGTGNVGIGTALTYSKLELDYSDSSTTTVSNGFTVLNSNGTTGVMAGMRLSTYGATNGGAYPKQFVGAIRTGSSGLGDIIFLNRNASDTTVVTASDERMRIAAAGNVGIGITSPAAKLDVTGPATGTGQTIHAGGGGDVVLGSGGSLFFDNNYSYASGSYIRPTASNTQTFFTSGSERLRITSAGNIGIGSASPQQNLDVEGTVYFGSGNVGVGTASPVGVLTVEKSTNTPSMVVFNNGTVGTPPSYPSSFTPTLVVHNSETVGSRPLFFGYRSGGGAWDAFLTSGACGTFSQMCLDFGTGSNVYTGLESIGTRLQIGGGDDGSFVTVNLANTGNVGIGSISPQQKLDVEGSVYVGSGGNIGIGTAAPVAGLQVGTGTSSLSANLNGTGALIKGNLEVDGKLYGDGSLLTGLSGLLSGLNTGYIPKAASATSINDSVVFQDSNGNIGIGSTVPQQKLDVEGAIYFGNGNVGVGTASPLTKLQVTDTSSGSPRGILSSQITSDTNGARVGFSKARGAAGALTTVVTGDTIGRLMFRGYDGSSYLEMASIEAVSTGTIASTRVPTYMSFSTGTDATPSVLTERLRIDAAGNVGIGSTVPQQKLDVEGGVYVGSGGNIGIGTAAPAAGLQVGTGTSSLGATLSGTGALIKGNLEVDGKLYGDGSLLTGLSGLLSGLNAGYITKAASATSISDSAVFQDSNGNIGIGSTTPQQKLDVEGAVYFGNGNVGIGSTAPQDPLAIRLDQNNNSRISISNQTNDTLAAASLKLFAADATGSLTVLPGNYTGGGAYAHMADRLILFSYSDAAGLDLYASGAAADIRFYAGGADVAHERVRILADGNMGIGSTAPQQKLDVEGTVYFGSGNVGIGTAAPEAGLQIGTGTSSLSATLSGTGALIKGNLEVDGKIYGDGSLLTNLSSSSQWSGTAGSAIYYNSANVGIGSASPQQTLDVEGSVYIGSGNVGIGTANLWNNLVIKSANGTATVAIGQQAGDANWAAIYLNGSQSANDYNLAGSSGTSDLWINRPTGGALIFSENDTAQDLVILSGGNIGIGTTAPVGLLDANRKLTVLSGGNVGIGSASPQQKLDVEGTVYFGSGNVGIGTVSPQDILAVEGAVYLASVSPSVTAYRLYNNSGTLTWNGMAVGAGAINTGLAGAFAYYPANGTAVDDQTVLYLSGSNVGVGVSSPGAKLEVNGEIIAGGSGDNYFNGNVGIGTTTPVSTLQINGSFAVKRNVPGAYPYTSASETIIGVTSTAADRTITLATVDCQAGRIVIIKDESGGAATHNITIATEGAQAIDGDTSDTAVKITANYGVVRVYADGSNWFTF